MIPAFNAARFLDDALDSVRRQTLRPAECIVVDDGSSDETRLVAEHHPACTACITQLNRGVSAARNVGAAHAHGTLLAFLDADDAWLPTRLESMTDRLEQAAAEAVLCATWLADESLCPQTRLSMDPGLSANDMLLGDVNLVSVSSNLLIAHTSFDSIGGFDETLSTSADWRLLFKLIDNLDWEYEPEPLVLYRQHSGGMSRNVQRMAREILRIYDEIFSSADAEQLTVRRPALGALHRTLSGSYFVNRQPGRAMHHAIKSITFAPREATYFWSAGRRQLRRRRRSHSWKR